MASDNEDAPLLARELPGAGSFSTPHTQSFAGAQFLYQQLANWDAQIQEQVALAGEDPDARFAAEISGSLERQALSEAVQILCAVTVEGAANLLGVLVLGEGQFMRRLEKARLTEKLKRVLRLLECNHTASYKMMIGCARRLSDARNGFVHPKPQEGRRRRNRTERRPDLRSAREAISDVHAFFGAIRSLDPRYSAFFWLFESGGGGGQSE